MKPNHEPDFRRRRFLQQAAFVAVALPVARFLMACTKKAAVPEGMQALSETDPVAQALGYKQDAAQVDTTKFPKKAAADGAQQKCSTCIQYTAQNEGWGKCAIFPQGAVAADGWCNTWGPKT